MLPAIVIERLAVGSFFFCSAGSATYVNVRWREEGKSRTSGLKTSNYRPHGGVFYSTKRVGEDGGTVSRVEHVGLVWTRAQTLRCFRMFPGCALSRLRTCLPDKHVLRQRLGRVTVYSPFDILRGLLHVSGSTN